MQNTNNQLDEILSSNDFNKFKNYSFDVFVNYKKFSSLYNGLLKSVSVDYIKSLNNEESIKGYVSSVYDIVSSEILTRQEKKLFLNGCENYLIQAALSVDLFIEATLFNSFKIDRDIYVFKQFIYSMLKKNKLESILTLLSFSENINFENSLILRISFMAGVRDINFYNTIVNLYNLDINEIGPMFNSSAQGSFSQLVFATFENNNFINEFIKYYKGRVNLENYFITKSTKKISSIDMIIHNNDISVSDRLLRLELLLDHNLLNDELLCKIIDYLFNPDIFLSNFENNVFFTMFTSNIFNSEPSYKNIVISKLIQLDFNDLINKVRLSNAVLEPVTYVFELLAQSSSQLVMPNYDLHISNWLEQSKSKRAPDSLIKSIFLVSQVKIDTFIRKDASLPNYVIEYFNPNIKKANFNLNIIQSEIKKPDSEINLKSLENITEENIKQLILSINELRENFLSITTPENKNDFYIRYTLPENVNNIISSILSFKGMSIQEQLTNLKSLAETLKGYEGRILENLDELVIN